MKMNHKGQSTIQLFTLIVISLVLVLVIGTYLFFFGFLNAAFQGDLNGGQVNLTEASDDTFGKINSGLINSADLIGIFFLFGVVFSIIITGFLTRNQTPKLMFMVDFLVLIFAYILAVYISNAYETILQTLPFTDLIAANLGNTSRFVLFLPTITVVTGFITIILTYAGIPRRRDELEVAGF